jgi:hypothetical protein
MNVEEGDLVQAWTFEEELPLHPCGGHPSPWTIMTCRPVQQSGARQKCPKTCTEEEVATEEEGRCLRMTGSRLGDVEESPTTTCTMVAEGALILTCMTTGGLIQRGASEEEKGGEPRMHMMTCMTPVRHAAFVLMNCMKT